MKYVFFIIFFGFSFCLYSMESGRQLDHRLDFQRIQERRFHESLDLLKHGKDYGDPIAWHNGKVSLESMAWGVRYVPYELGRKVEKKPYWPAIYAVGALALSEGNLDKAFRSVYEWRQYCLSSLYKETEEGKKVDQNIENLFLDLLSKNNLGACSLQAVELLKEGKLNKVRNLIEKHFEAFFTTDPRQYVWYKDFFDFLRNFKFTEQQCREQTSTIYFLEGVSYFFTTRTLRLTNDECAKYFSTVIERLNCLYESNSLDEPAKKAVRTMLAESNQRLAWLTTLNVKSLSLKDFDHYLRRAIELGDSSSTYYQALKILRKGSGTLPEVTKQAFCDLEKLAEGGYKDAKIFLGKWYAGLLNVYPENYQDEDPIFMEKAQSLVRDLANISDPYHDADALLIMGVTATNPADAKAYLEASINKGNTKEALQNWAYAMVCEGLVKEALMFIENQPDYVKRHHYLLLALLHLHLCEEKQSGIHFDKMREYSIVLFNSFTSAQIADLFLNGATARGQRKIQHDLIFGLLERLKEYKHTEIFEFLFAFLREKATPELLLTLKQTLS